jgi:hypothetical protein
VLDGKNPGIYMELCGKETFDNKNIKFLLKHPNLRWTDTWRTNVTQIRNQVTSKNNIHTYSIGKGYAKGATWWNWSSGAGKILEKSRLIFTTNEKTFQTTNILSVLTCFRKK